MSSFYLISLFMVRYTSKMFIKAYQVCPDTFILNGHFCWTGNIYVCIVVTSYKDNIHTYLHCTAGL